MSYSVYCDCDQTSDRSGPENGNFLVAFSLKFDVIGVRACVEGLCRWEGVVVRFNRSSGSTREIRPRATATCV